MPKSPRIALSAALIGVCLASAAQCLELVGTTVWSDPDPAFGGLSGLSVSADGTRVMAVGDKGILVEGRMTRAADGTLEGVETVAIHTLTGKDGAPLKARETDAEGVDWVAPDRLVMSFELFHRVEEVGLDGVRLRRLPRPKFFKSFQNNSSLESVAVDAAGRVFTVPERSGELDRPFPVYMRKGNSWVVPFELPRSEDFLVVGLDFGPDGRLYVLERALRGLFFASRVRAISLNDRLQITGEVTVLETVAGTHNNLEGISVWRDASGRTRMSLIADDNFNIFFRTEIVEYLLD